MGDRRRKVVVTGGTGGLGQAVTLAFLEAGWDAYVTFIEQHQYDALERMAPTGAGRLAGLRADLTRAEDLESLAGQLRRECESIDALVNLVGGFAGGHPVTETPESVWDHMIRLNLKTVFLTVRSVGPLVSIGGGGSIVNVGARGGVDLVPGLAAYGVSKAGVVALTRVLAEEMRSENVRVNCVLPSIIDTPANRASMPDADFSRWVSPEALARVILFLAGPDSGAVSGACVPVYGDA